MILSALSIRQPWASLLIEKKTIETRTWQTHYRGDLLICSSKKPASESEIFRLALPGEFLKLYHGLANLPYGQALAVAELTDCRKLAADDEQSACVQVSACPLHYAWILENIRPIKPFPVRGRLGIFSINVEGYAYE